MEAIMERLTTTEAAVAAGRVAAAGEPRHRREDLARRLVQHFADAHRADRCLSPDLVLLRDRGLVDCERPSPNDSKRSGPRPHLGAVEELRRRRPLSDGPLCRSLEERGRPAEEVDGRGEDGGGRPGDFERDSGHSGNPVPVQIVAALVDAGLRWNAS